MPMNSHELAMSAINYIKPDRPPLDYSATSETTAKLMNYFDIVSYDELLCKLGACPTFIIFQIKILRVKIIPIF